MALGLTRYPIFRKVILPQALIIALRPFGNEIILMIKGSAVAAIVTVFDLMGVTRLAFSRSFDISVYLWAAVLYLILVEIAPPRLGPARAPPDAPPAATWRRDGGKRSIH